MAAASASSSAGSTVRRSSTTRPSSIRPTTGGVPVRRPRSRASGDPAPRARADRRQRLARAAIRHRPSLGCRPRRRRRRRRRASRARPPAPEHVDRRRQLPPHRDLPCRDARPVQPEGRRDRREHRLVRPHRSRQRVLAKPRDELAAADDEPGLRTPTSLSPLNVTRSAPSARRSAGVGSCARPNAAVSSSAPLPRSSTTSAPCSCASRASAADPAPPRTHRAGSSTGGPAAPVAPAHRPAAPRSRRRASGSSSRPRSASRRRGGRSRGSGPRHRSRPAPRG